MRRVFRNSSVRVLTMRRLLDGAGCTMRKVQIGQMQFMVDRESTRQRHVQVTNAAQEATNEAGGH